MKAVFHTSQPGPLPRPVTLSWAPASLSHLGRRAGEWRFSEVGENQGNTFLFGFRPVWPHIV